MSRAGAEALLITTQCNLVRPLPYRCKLLILCAATATNQKVGSSNLSGRTISFLFSLTFQHFPSSRLACVSSLCPELSQANRDGGGPRRASLQKRVATAVLLPCVTSAVSSCKGHPPDLSISRVFQAPNSRRGRLRLSALPAQYYRNTRTSLTHVTADTYIDHRRMVAPTLPLSRAVGSQHGRKLEGTVLGISPGETGARVS